MSLTLTREQLTLLFTTADLNRTGFIDLGKIEAGRVMLSRKVPKEWMDLVESALRDGDIDNDKQLTLDEFLAYMEQHQA